MTLIIETKQQRLFHFNNQGIIVDSYPISTAKNGLGERKNSFQTPRGLHKICAKIGAGCPINTIFRARRPTGEVYDAKEDDRQQDWILTRILWLSGLEVGFNRLGDVDTMQRYIYIHGTADEAHIGEAVSCGCIRMRNRDILTLFDRVSVGEHVNIKE